MTAPSIRVPRDRRRLARAAAQLIATFGTDPQAGQDSNPFFLTVAEFAGETLGDEVARLETEFSDQLPREHRRAFIAVSDAYTALLTARILTAYALGVAVGRVAAPESKAGER